jgi:hypothetical protein
MPGPGVGANSGFGVGGGGIPYLTDLIPAPEVLLPDDGFWHFTVGVQGGLIDLSMLFVRADGQLAFDGTTASFTARYAADSSYEYDPANNGYVFHFRKDEDYLSSHPTVTVEATTVDGSSWTNEYSFAVLSPIYPPAPFGQILGTVSLDEFSGEAGGLLASNGLVFFSPALSSPHAGNEIDVDDLELRVRVTDPYVRKDSANGRPFLVGPPPLVPPPSPPVFPPTYSDPDYMPVLNSAVFTLLKNKPEVVGEMFDTVSLETTMILY